VRCHYAGRQVGSPAATSHATSGQLHPNAIPIKVVAITPSHSVLSIPVLMAHWIAHNKFSPRQDIDLLQEPARYMSCNSLQEPELEGLELPVKTKISIFRDVMQQAYLGFSNSTNAKAGGLGGSFRSMFRMRPYCSKTVNDEYEKLQS